MASGSVVETGRTISAPWLHRATATWFDRFRACGGLRVMPQLFVDADQSCSDRPFPERPYAVS